MKKIFTSEVNGFIVPNILAMVLIAISKQLHADDAGLLVFSEFIIIPLLIGIGSAWFWRKLSFRRYDTIIYSLVNTVLGLGLSYLVLGEGYLCLIIVSPLLFAFIVIGTVLGRNLFEKDNTTLNVSVITLLFLIFIVDSVSKHTYVNEVSDTMVINAAPNKIWKYVVAYKRINAPNKFWLFRIGMPSPIESTADGCYKGANRKCIFSNGYVFDEKIVTYQENKDLTFDITNQPKDPEIMRHIDILRGQFILKDNGDGTTTLTGNSWYQLYVFPAWYYDLWAKSVTRNVHLRVMERIKELSEAK